MKQTMTIALLTLSLSIAAFATTPKTSTTVDWSKAEKNYLVALSSENIGLRRSATGFLAEYRLSGAVKPLIEILKNDKVEQLRMAAAVALMQLGNNDGIEAVKEASIYDGSEKVAKFCEQLINSTTKDLSLR